MNAWLLPALALITALLRSLDGSPMLTWYFRESRCIVAARLINECIIGFLAANVTASPATVQFIESDLSAAQEKANFGIGPMEASHGCRVSRSRRREAICTRAQFG